MLISIGGESKKTTVQNEAGKTPKWADIVTFYEKGNTLKVIVKDEDIGSDDLVGEGSMDISQAFLKPNQPNTRTIVLNSVNIPILFQRKSAGTLTVTVVFK